MQVSALHRKPSTYVTHQFPNVITMWKNDYLYHIKLSKDRILLDNETRYMIVRKLHFGI
jgi:hypothetical protein